MTTNKKTVVLLFGGGLQLLSVARELDGSGYDVILASMDISIAKHCRYISHCIKLPDISSLTPEQMMEHLSGYDFSLIIPLEDEYSQWLSVNKTIMETVFGKSCAVEKYEKYELAANKSKLMHFLEIHNLPHPRTRTLDSDYIISSEYIGFPLLLKPDVSNGSRGILKVESLSELKEKAPSCLSSGKAYSMQEYVNSKSYYFNVMMYRDRDGIITSSCIIRILRYYPVSGGSSCFCVSEKNDELVNICSKVLESLDWYGFADFDILEDEAGAYEIIEINPRVPASVRAASVSGVKFGEIIADDTSGRPIKSYEYKPGRFLRYLGLDILWFISSDKRFSAKPSWFTAIGPKVYLQEGGKGDIIAMFASFLTGLKKQLNPNFRKQKSGMN